MKKLFYLIVFLSTVFASAQGLEPKTYVGNGVVIGPKTTTEINALTVTPNGYVQVNETTGTIFLRIGGSWVNTGLASNTSITDTGNNFTATDVEGALAELAGASGGTPADDSITPAMMADGDFGAFSIFNNVAALDNNSVTGNALQDFSIYWAKFNTAILTSQAQAEAGTDDARIMTPLRTAQAIAKQAIRWHPDNADTSGRLFVGTVAQEAAGTFTANDIKIITDAPPANVITGTSIAMTAYDYLDDRAVDTNAFTFSDPDVGEITIIRLNQAGVPTFSGTGITFVQLDGTYQWEDNTDIKAYFEAQSATEIHYFFQKVQ